MRKSEGKKKRKIENAFKEERKTKESLMRTGIMRQPKENEKVLMK